MPQPPELPLAHLNIDHHQILLDALEAARKSVCGYGPLARTCDCKYGLVPPQHPDDLIPVNAIDCTHRNCEHTGCPELRNLIKATKQAQRQLWARRSAHHGRTAHGWLCCASHPSFDPDTTDPMRMLRDDSLGGASCGGPWWCFTCTPEADRIHGLLPPADTGAATFNVIEASEGRNPWGSARGAA